MANRTAWGSRSRSPKIVPLRFFSLLLLLAASLFLAVLYGANVLNKLKAKDTQARMLQLYSMLAGEGVTRIEPESFDLLIAKYNLGASTKDAWGSDLQIKIETDEKGTPHYEIRSLGEDGKLGSCCTKHVYEEWEEDSVLRDGVWLQIW